MINKTSKILFYVDSVESNPEIFATYGEAIEYADVLKVNKDTCIFICARIVNNTYYETDGTLNYTDLSNTFGEVLKKYEI